MAEINKLHTVLTITVIIKAKLYSGCVCVLWFERIAMPKTLQIMQFVLLLVKTTATNIFLQHLTFNPSLLRGLLASCLSNTEHQSHNRVIDKRLKL